MLGQMVAAQSETIGTEKRLSSLFLWPMWAIMSLTAVANGLRSPEDASLILYARLSSGES